MEAAIKVWGADGAQLGLNVSSELQRKFEKLTDRSAMEPSAYAAIAPISLCRE